MAFHCPRDGDGHSQSRTSTHKRQKQYFEQRKRHHQHHTTGFESYADGRRSYTENNRSLDILSLANVSAAAQELAASRVYEAGDNSEDCDFTSDHQYRLPYQVTLDAEDLPVDQVQIKAKGSPSSYGTEAVYSQKVPTHLQDDNENLHGNENKLDPFKLSATLSEISVIDLLSDSRPNTKAEKNSAHAQEAHVSFSVEGLGKVETETPVQSPTIHGRPFPNYLSPQKKARRQPSISKHTNYGFHDPESQVDFDISPYYSSIDQTFCSKDMMNIIGDPNLMFSNRRCSSPLNWDSSNSQGAFDDDELIYNIRDSGRNIWNGPSFLEASIDDLGEHEIFCKNWDDQGSVTCDDYFRDNDIWKQGFSFDGQSLTKRRFNTERTEIFDIKASPVLYSKHHTTEDLSDKISNTRYSAVRIDDDVKDPVNRFAREDNRESLSLLSEESCSSTAVRGDATRNNEQHTNAFT
ncbi:Unknown protein [Striga hermonthica]|uniref:Uncharacterized protein n=1 Tax=Striga hermonthica TaxID=68872 RepID=A0A9N7NX26_STRHE|nr:Unknown protein [Striga hermonthica]